jgi:hypothetical protein
MMQNMCYNLKTFCVLGSLKRMYNDYFSVDETTLNVRILRHVDHETDSVLQMNYACHQQPLPYITCETKITVRDVNDEGPYIYMKDDRLLLKYDMLVNHLTKVSSLVKTSLSKRSFDNMHLRIEYVYVFFF